MQGGAFAVAEHAVARRLLADASVIKPHGFAVRRALAVTVLFTAWGCKPRAEKLADQLETSASWLAAIDMAGRSWSANRVPLRFARQIVEEARSGLTASARAIADLPVHGVDGPMARAELVRAVTSVDTMLAALDRRDSVGVGRAMPVIAARREAIDSMAKRAKSISE
jgi:hypothetical protein